jgi:peptidoglycan/xylan/chitin deacetylase (PgdA/CDA1 family)
VTSLLVRRRDLEAVPPPAGEFRSVRYGKGFVPSWLFASFGTHCVDTRERVVSLTYDDGPNPRDTPRILDLLAERRATATFFVLAEPAAQHPDIIRRIVVEGHEVALHGPNHRALTDMSDREALDGIRRSRATVEDIAGVPVRLYRPPYGSHTLRQAWGIRRLGLELIIWSGDALDWLHDTEAAVAKRAIAGIFPGAILLLHDARADPERLGPGERLPEFDRADVLRRVLGAIDERGYTTATTSELLRAHPHVKSMSREAMFRS